MPVFLKNLFAIASIAALGLSSASPAAAAMDSAAPATEEKERAYALHFDVGSKSANVWAGWKFSNGPVLQPTLSLSVEDPFLGDFSAGVYMNMYISQLDNRNGTRSTASQKITGNKSLGLGKIDEGQLFATWGRSWGDYSLGVSYWHYSYGWKLDYTDLEWFGHRSSGELTVAPSYAYGDFTFFTEQNVVVVPPNLGGANLKECDPADTTCKPLVNINAKQSDLGAYHAVFGVTWAKESGNMGLDLTAKTEWANWKFIEGQIYQGDNQVRIQAQPWYQKFYHLTLNAGTSYSPNSWATISSYFGVQYMLNKWIDTDKDLRGSFPFAGITTSFTYGL